MIVNSVTQELVNGKSLGIFVVPVFKRRSFVEFLPKRGGFAAKHEIDVASSILVSREKETKNACIIRDDSPVGTPGNELVETHTYVILRLLDGGGYEECVIHMSKSQLRTAKKWNTSMKLLQHKNKPVPIFYGVWNLKTIPEMNDQGNWFSWKVDFVKPLHEFTEDGLDIYKDARELRINIEAGSVEVESHQALLDDGTASPKKVSYDELDDNIPF